MKLCGQLDKHIPTEIIYDQGPEFIGHELIKLQIKIECGIIAKPSTLGNQTSNAILERIRQVVGILVQTYNIK